MTNQTLKEQIEKNVFDSFPLVLHYTDSPFVAKTYAKQLAKNMGLELKYIDDLSELTPQLLFIDESYLYVYEVDKIYGAIPSDKDLIVITKEVDPDFTGDYVDLIPLKHIDILNYVASRLSGLNVNIVTWLCENCKYDIYRIETEIHKLEIFPPTEQQRIFALINDDNGYCDLTSHNIFDFTKAIMLKDYTVIGQMFPELDTADLEPLACVSILIKNFKALTNFLFNPNATAKGCNMTEKQFYFLKKHPEKYTAYTKEEVIRNIEFLEHIDYDVKMGNLDLTREQLLAYVVSGVLQQGDINDNR